MIHTFGCQMNENDSEHISGILRALGAVPAGSFSESHVIIVNTCAVRQKSEDKLYSLLGRLRVLKNQKLFLLGVTGCVAQLHQSEILQKFPYVDFIMGPDNYWRMPGILAEHPLPFREFYEIDRHWHEIDHIDRRRPSSGYVTIMEGCSNFCAYCVVPFTRGPEKFRSRRRILDEVRRMIKQGCREVVFLGQNVNSYIDPDSGGGFPDLLKQAGGMEGLGWLRFITSHPKDFDRATALVMRDSPAICRQLHLPVQSGSNRILDSMNRKYSRERYLNTAAMLRDIMPDISLSTDIIVGFPGESEEDFEQTLDVLDKVRYTNIFSFQYSPRPATAASKWEDSIPYETKKKRLIQLQNHQKSIQLHDNRRCIGKRMKVLCTGRSKKDPNAHEGRNEAHQVVNFTSGEDVTADFVTVEITGAGPYSLRGRRVE